ncbi:hypothetical protein [Micromonospora sp. ATA51]|uniref:hypothetical protein n=1 Tax=Micromonospora sp. ATA51 TaxID=2806098 RepID=UPI001A36E4FB|nr:hypothetical protein [Micromonospora sp. ATA51]MBM0226852.1 hypothetical protein [Micromonospora sp. ATA51]
MERQKRLMLACPPTNINELLEGMGVPPFVPTVDHTLTQCVDCRADVWIGPNQRAAASRAPQTCLVLCMACALAEQHKRGGGVVGHLGGGNGRPRLPG